MNNTTILSESISNVSSFSLLPTIALGAVVALGLGVYCRTTKSTIDEKPLPLPEPPIGSKFVTLPESGVNLRYADTATEDGNKRKNNDDDKHVTFVMLHGFAGVLETWELLTPNLRKESSNLRVRVVALDLVGSGFSDKPDGSNFDYSYRNQGKVVSELLSVLNLSNVVVVGHSSGTVVGAATATGDKRIVGAVFVDGALFRPKPEFFSKSWLKPLFSWMTTKMLSDRKQSLAKMHLPENAERVLTDEFVAKFAAPTRLPGFGDALVDTVMAKEAPYEELVDQLLSETKPIPMLFAWGAADLTHKPLPSQQIESIQTKLNDIHAEHPEKQPIVETKLVENSSHYPQHEQPEALASGILSFVRKNVALQ